MWRFSNSPVNLLDAADRVENLSREEIRALLREAAVVIGDLLKRDKRDENLRREIPA